MQRHPVYSVAFLLIFWNNLSSQENVTVPCQLCLHLPPPPTRSLSLSISLLLIPLTSHLQHADFSLPSYPITHFVFSSLCIASPAVNLRDSSTGSAKEQTVFILNILWTSPVDHASQGQQAQ